MKELTQVQIRSSVLTEGMGQGADAKRPKASYRSVLSTRTMVATKLILNILECTFEKVKEIVKIHLNNIFYLIQHIQGISICM